MKRVYRRIDESVPGTLIMFEYVADFFCWADGVVPTPKAIMEHLGVSRATAYRYWRAYQTLLEKYGSLKFERKRRAG